LGPLPPEKGMLTFTLEELASREHGLR